MNIVKFLACFVVYLFSVLEVALEEEKLLIITPLW